MVHMITKRHFSDVIMVLFLNGYKCQFGLILFSYYKVVFFLSFSFFNWCSWAAGSKVRMFVKFPTTVKILNKNSFQTGMRHMTVKLLSVTLFA